jgi:hypothetical protein
LRHSIASLPLPDLDYDRIKQDVQQVLVDPRAGLESLSSSLGDTLRDQLSTLNRDTLAALISTRDDLSTTFAQQITDRLDAARLSAIAQIETCPASRYPSPRRPEATGAASGKRNPQSRRDRCLVALCHRVVVCLYVCDRGCPSSWRHRVDRAVVKGVRQIGQSFEFRVLNATFYH